MDQKMVITVVLGVLLVFSLFQTVQLVSVKNKIASGELGEVTKTSSSDTGLKAGAAAPPPRDLNSLDNMVGGC